jgi:hypothetical protein
VQEQFSAREIHSTGNGEEIAIHTRAICNDPSPIADELPDGYRMGVVVAVVAVMPIWLRKCAGRKERKQDKY